MHVIQESRTPTFCSTGRRASLYTRTTVRNSTPTWSRTRICGFENRRDVRFTIEATSGPRGDRTRTLGMPCRYPPVRREAQIVSGPPRNRTGITSMRRWRLPVRPAAQSRSTPESNRLYLAYQGGVLPQHLRTGADMIPDGVEPSLPACHTGVFAAGPRDQNSDQGGTRTHTLQALDLTALPVCLPGPMDSRGSGSRTHVERLMRPCWNHLQSIPR